MKLTKNKFVLLFLLFLVASLILSVIDSYHGIFENQDPATVIYKKCLISMKNNNCSIMLGPQSFLLNANDNQVLIVGVGKVDATLYRQFRDNPQMCSEIKASCKADLNSPTCHLAKLLYQNESSHF